MREGSTERVMSALKNVTDIFNMESFRDRSQSQLGALQIKNIKSFGLYLENKVKRYSEVGDDYVTDKEVVITKFKTASLDNEFFIKVQDLQKLINSLLACSVIYLLI